MPRHPPYALTNLTTDTRKRCSRPLCSSQTTNEPNPTPHTHPHPSHEDHQQFDRRNWPATEATVPRPPANQQDRGPVPSGPNSVRPTTRATQDPDNEDDHPPTPPPTGPSPQAGRTRSLEKQHDGRSRRSTHERPHPTHKAGNVAT